MILLSILFLILLDIYFKKKKIKINLYPFVIILLILFSGLKYQYTYDYDNYLIHFNEINSFKDVLNTGFEKGYSFLIFLFKITGLGFNSFLLFIAFISIKMKEKVFNKFSPLPDISLLLYFLLFYITNDVEQIRHGISIGFCFYSLCYLCNENLYHRIYSLFLIICAILFHTSAILFIPIYIIRDRYFNKKVYIFLIAISILLSFVDYFGILSMINDTVIHSPYLSQKISEYNSDKGFFLSITLILKLFIILIFYYFAFDYKNKFHRLMFNTYYIGIIYTILLCNIPILVARSTSFMRYSELIMIPIYIVNIKNMKNKAIHFIILLLIFAYYIFKFLNILLKQEYFFYTSI